MLSQAASSPTPSLCVHMMLQNMESSRSILPLPPLLWQKKYVDGAKSHKLIYNTIIEAKKKTYLKNSTLMQPPEKNETKNQYVLVFLRHWNNFVAWLSAGKTYIPSPHANITIIIINYSDIRGRCFQSLEFEQVVLL